MEEHFYGGTPFTKKRILWRNEWNFVDGPAHRTHTGRLTEENACLKQTLTGGGGGKEPPRRTDDRYGEERAAAIGRSSGARTSHNQVATLRLRCDVTFAVRRYVCGATLHRVGVTSRGREVAALQHGLSRSCTKTWTLDTSGGRRRATSVCTCFEFGF